jgi:putative PEP-CTERM system TPR-repeat lipoprotein
MMTTGEIVIKRKHPTMNPTQWNKPFKAGIAALLCIVLAACGDSPDSLVKSAQDYIAKGQSNAALIQLRSALQKAPNNAEARYLLGMLLTERRDPAGAVKELRKALDLGYSADRVLPVLARALVDDGDAKELVKDFGDKTLTDADAQAALKTTIGHALVDLDRPKDAETAFNAALKAKPDHGGALLGLATLRVRERKPDEAKKIVDAVLARPNAPPEAALLQAQLMFADGQKDAARAVLERLVDTKPDYLPGRYRLTGALIAAGELDKASAQVDAIRKVSKQDQRAYYFEALIASNRGELPAARQAIQQVLKTSPRYLAALVLAGEIEYRAKAYNQAEDYLRRALNIAPGLAYPERLLAATYLGLGSPSRALEVLQQQINRGYRDSQLMGIAGEAYLASGNLPKAAEYLGQMTALEPKNAAARARLGQVKFAEGDTEGAISDLEAASSLDPNVSTADLALVANLLRQGKSDEALAAVGALEKKQPSNPLVYNLKGLVYVVKRDLVNARASFEHALQVQSDYLPAVASLAQIDRMEQKPDVARKRFQAILDKEPKNEQALLGYAELVASLGGDPAEIESLIKRAVTASPQSFAPRLALINFYLRKGDAKQAQLAAQEANAAQPNDARTLEMLGQIQLASGETTLAIGTFNKLVAARPGSPDALMRLGRALAVAKDYDRAIERMREALKINPDLFEASREIAAIYVMSGHPDQAAQEVKTLQRLRPDDPRVYVLEGDLLAAQKKLAESEIAYKAAQKRTPDDGAVAAKLHAVVAANGKAAQADAAADKWLREHPKDLVLRNYLAERATRSQDYKTAARYYQAMVAQQPDNVAYLNNFAWVAGESGDPKALSYAERAATLAPDNPAVLDTFGTLLIKKGDLTAGLEKLRRAAKLAPSQGDIRLHLAKALIQTGDKEGARKELDVLARAGTPAGGAAANVPPAPAGSPQSPTCSPACAAEVASLLKTL